MFGPCSANSCEETHIFLNEAREARIDPPIHALYFLSGGADILSLQFGPCR